ncbi:MAG: PAS domain S-box protein [Sandaracinaceae bacterium]
MGGSGSLHSSSDPEERFRRLSEAATEGVALHEDGLILDANVALARMVGYTVDELVGQSALMIAAPDSRQRVIDAIRSGAETPYEVEGLRKDGSVFPAEVRARVIHSGGERLRVTVIRDISEQKAAERALARSEERLRNLIEQAADGIVVSDAEGRIEEVNQAFCAFLERDRADIVGRSIGELMDPDELAREPLELERLAAGERLTRERTFLTKAGATVPTEISATALSDGRLQGIVRDIRQRREREQLERKFFQAQKMESVGRLAGGIAHDFNNLLMIILGSAELIRADKGNTDKLATDIVQAADQGARLTRQLLAFSRQQVLQVKRVDLGAIVQRGVRVLRRLIGEDVALEVTVASDPLWIRADPAQIEQLLMNLAVNARDAMPRGGALTLEVAREAERAVMRVIDSGVGMDDETLSRAIEPFFTTKEVGRGTGLGLSTVFGVVRQSGGEMQIQSAPGEGTAVQISFPIADQPESPPPVAQATPEGGVAEALTVLLVEDDPDVRSTIALLLAREGHHVLQASGPAQARAQLAEHGDAIGVMITDVVMPGESGRALADEMATARPDLKILFASGYTDDEIERVLGTDRPVRLLRKPFTRAELRAALASLY